MVEFFLDKFATKGGQRLFGVFPEIHPNSQSQWHSAIASPKRNPCVFVLDLHRIAKLMVLHLAPNSNTIIIFHMFLNINYLNSCIMHIMIVIWGQSWYIFVLTYVCLFFVLTCVCLFFSHVFFVLTCIFLFWHVFFSSHVFVYLCINCVGTQNRELGWKISPQINQWISNEVEYENINSCLSWGFIRCFKIHWKYTFSGTWL